MTTLTVGQNQQYATIAAAVAASKNGDVVAVQAGTYTNDFATITHRITLQGVGGMVNMVATVAPPNGKAILTTGTDVTVDHFSFSGAAVADGNGAGIRYEGGNLVVTNSWFHDNQEGLLAGAVADGTILIQNTEFGHNGTGDGLTHNLYVGAIKSLTVQNSYVHDAVVGHEIKSRAASTTITGSRIADGPTGTASYSIDLPNGGAAVIQGNVIEQGPASQNTVIIAYGEEGSVPAASSLLVSGNTILNDLHRGPAVLNASTVAAAFNNNAVYGFTSALVQGSATQSGTTTLAAEPALNTSAPYSNSTPGFSVTDLVSGQASTASGTAYAGPVSYLQQQYIWAGAGGVAVAANAANVFLHGGAGNDALTATSGNNVLDGGQGSNFLTGTTSGLDTFFVDGRGGGTTWDSIVNFHKGDSLTVWGFQAGVSTLAWAAQDGAAGYQGVTLHSALGGAGTAVNASATFVGLTMGDMQSKFSSSTGSVGGSAYLQLTFKG